MALTREQIIDLIDLYIYANGNQMITAAQLSEILVQMADSFAMKNGGGAGIDAVLAAGSNVSAGRKITNSEHGSLVLSASKTLEDFTYKYLGAESSGATYQNVNYVGDILTLSGSFKRTDATQDVFEMILSKNLAPGEYIAATATIANGNENGDGDEGIDNGIISIAHDGRGRVARNQNARGTETEVRGRREPDQNGTLPESIHRQTIDTIESIVENGSGKASFTQMPFNIQLSTYGSKGGVSTLDMDPAKIVSKVEAGTVTDSIHVAPTGKIGGGGTGITSRDVITNEQSSTLLSPQNIFSRVSDTDEGSNGTILLQSFTGVTTVASVGDQHAYLDIDPSTTRSGTRFYATDSTTLKESYVAVKPTSLSLVVDGGDLESGITQTAASISVEANSINLIGELNFMKAGTTVLTADGASPSFEITHGMTDPTSMSVTFGDGSSDAFAKSKKVLTPIQIKIECPVDAPAGEIVVYWQVFK